MKIKHIFCDMDGVIADFFGATMRLFDFDPAEYPANEWDIAAVVGITQAEFWQAIDDQPTFWRDLQPYPWAAELVAMLNESGVPWSIASSPCRDPKCLAQKVEWLRQHVHPGFDRYMLGHQKHLLAGPGRLLIDDAAHNIDAFRQHGGTAIVFPRRWNHWNQFEHCGMQVVRERLQMELSK